MSSPAGDTPASSTSGSSPLRMAIAVGVVLLVGMICWMLNDLRLALRESTAMLQDSLPQILENTRQSTETLASLSDDLKQLRDLAGSSTVPRDRSLVRFADGILDRVEQSGGQIGVNKLIGSGLKNVVPAAEWVTGARKEALWLTFRARSRRELLDRLCHSGFGSPWQIQFDEDKPQPLEDWLAAQDPEIAELRTEEEAETAP
ncbi:MAG: hypothetical protein KDA79_15015 [Planctomycetaceae bacterium]|nr:hypothetical protein [Planctomycetaceae bacterium]